MTEKEPTYTAKQIFFLLAITLKDFKAGELDYFDAINAIIEIFEADIPKELPYFIPKKEEE